MPVVHGVAATPMSVSATPVHLHSALNNTQANNNRVPGYDHSPNLGQPFSGLFDCDGAFWMSCCCPCIVGGQVSQKLGTSSFAVVVAAYVGTCVTLIIIVAVSNVDAFWLLLWLGWTCFVYSVRTHVRRMWAIPGDSCDDFCVTCCCTACSLAQVTLVICSNTILVIYHVTFCVIDLQVAKHVFGYRQSDYPPCGSDGTPSWQHSHVTSNVSPPSIGFVQQTPQHV
jgi:Cys-rich protein (TIGR01571 family)